MEDGLLSLKWNNHKSTFFHILSSLRKKETYTDATLACEGKFFPVHKLVMSTCSDYFCEVFERTTCKSPVVILKDIRHHDLEALLDYMYLGEVDVKQSELAGLIKAAECLRIKGLAVPDEDPSLSHKKPTHVPESRSSPLAKRSRRESGESAASHHYGSHKIRRSLSPANSSRSHSSSTITSTSVPSQSVNSDSLSQVPSHAMPPPIYSDPRPPLSELSSSSNDAQKHPDQSLVPVDMIKVEVEDEGSGASHLRQHDPSSEHGVGREEPMREGGGEESGGGGGGRGDKEPISNNFSDYSSHPGEIEKEEHDQIDNYNGSDQIPGPSGVQGAPQIMNWGEEEGNFPHNLFGGEDSSHQQVFGSFYEEVLNDPPSSFLDEGNVASAFPFHRKFPSKKVPADVHAAAVTASAVAMQRGSAYYQCPLCPKKSKRRDHLRLHLRTHTGERPYACSFCPHRACQKSDLDKHLRTHLRR